MFQTDTDTLEKLVDDYGLRAVLEDLGQICHEKADHIRASYDSKRLANRWDAAGRKMDAVANLKTVVWVS